MTTDIHKRQLNSIAEMHYSAKTSFYLHNHVTHKKSKQSITQI